MTTQGFWESVAAKQEAEQARITAFQPGYSGIGQYNALQAHVASAKAGDDGPGELRFYLGPHTRLSLETPSLPSLLP